MKPHIKRSYMSAVGVWVWGVYLRRQSPKPFALSRSAAGIFISARRHAQ